MRSDDTLQSAVITLCEHQILSAPVFDSKGVQFAELRWTDRLCRELHWKHRHAGCNFVSSNPPCAASNCRASYLFVLAPKACKPSELNCLKLDQVQVQKVMGAHAMQHVRPPRLPFARADASKRNPLMPFFEENPLSMLVSCH